MKLLTLLLVLPLGACASTATSFNVKVDALAAPASAGLSTYALECERDSESPLLWQEYAGCIERALDARGFRRLDDPSRADFSVLVNYSIQGENYVGTYQDPVWGQTGVTTTYSTNTNPYLPYQATETTTPEYGITHYETRTYDAVRHHRAIELTAYGLASGRPSGDPIWSTRIRSTGTSGDMRRVFPVLIAAAQPYFGTSTGKEITVMLQENDERVELVAGIQR